MVNYGDVLEKGQALAPLDDFVESMVGDVAEIGHEIGVRVRGAGQPGSRQQRMIRQVVHCSARALLA